ncbi:MAG: hypothetical protein AAB354_13355 [candidate division KSB1 bacterium]
MSSSIPCPQLSNPFRLLCQGRWPPEQVFAHYNPTRHILPSPHDELALSYWQQLLTVGDKHLFNGQLFRLESQEARLNRLELVLGHTCYRDQIYCNAHVQALTQTYGENVLARGLGVSAMVVTCDGYLPLLRRGERVGEEPGKLDVFGGHAHPEQHLIAGRPDLFRAMADEIVAELNVAPEAIAENVCRGLVENLRTHKPDLVFEISLRSTREEIAQGATHAAEAEEVAELFFVRHNGEAVQKFLADFAHELTPSAHGTLALGVAERSHCAWSD